MVQKPCAVNGGAPIYDFSVIAKFEFCAVTAFGVKFVITSFVSVCGEMRTLIVEFFDGWGARGSENVKCQEFAWCNAL